MIDFMPDAQTLLIVVAGTLKGIEAPSAACRAGACPTLALQTLPINTSSIASGGRRAALSAALKAAAPKSVAETEERLWPKLPKGVRFAETI